MRAQLKGLRLTESLPIKTKLFNVIDVDMSDVITLDDFVLHGTQVKLLASLLHWTLRLTKPGMCLGFLIKMVEVTSTQKNLSMIFSTQAAIRQLCMPQNSS